MTFDFFCLRFSFFGAKFLSAAAAASPRAASYPLGSQREASCFYPVSVLKIGPPRARRQAGHAHSTRVGKTEAGGLSPISEKKVPECSIVRNCRCVELPAARVVLIQLSSSRTEQGGGQTEGRCLIVTVVLFRSSPKMPSQNRLVAASHAGSRFLLCVCVWYVSRPTLTRERQPTMRSRRYSLALAFFLG